MKKSEIKEASKLRLPKDDKNYYSDLGKKFDSTDGLKIECYKELFDKFQIGVGSIDTLKHVKADDFIKTHISSKMSYIVLQNLRSLYEIKKLSKIQKLAETGKIELSIAREIGKQCVNSKVEKLEWSWQLALSDAQLKKLEAKLVNYTGTVREFKKFLSVDIFKNPASIPDTKFQIAKKSAEKSVDSLEDSEFSEAEKAELNAIYRAGLAKTTPKQNEVVPVDIQTIVQNAVKSALSAQVTQ